MNVAMKVFDNLTGMMCLSLVQQFMFSNEGVRPGATFAGAEIVFFCFIKEANNYANGEPRI